MLGGVEFGMEDVSDFRGGGFRKKDGNVRVIGMGGGFEIFIKKYIILV